MPNPLDRHLHSWASLLLPSLDDENLYLSIDYDVSSLHPNNREAASAVVSTFRCPSFSGPDYSDDPNYTRFGDKYAIQNYVAMGSSDVGHIYGQKTGLFAPDGIIYPLSSHNAGDVTDGLSNTILIAETREEKMMVWIDGGTAAVVTKRYDDANSPSYAGPEISLNYSPYFDYSNPYAEWGPSSQHTGGGALHLYGDGSVHFISENISAHIYVAATTRANNESNANAF